MVKSHAWRFVPSWKLSILDHALTKVSWTRSSARSGWPHNDTANALRERTEPRSSSRRRGEIVIFSGFPQASSKVQRFDPEPEQQQLRRKRRAVCGQYEPGW